MNWVAYNCQKRNFQIKVKLEVKQIYNMYAYNERYANNAKRMPSDWKQTKNTQSELPRR